MQCVSNRKYQLCCKSLQIVDSFAVIFGVYMCVYIYVCVYRYY